ncbi:MULTISPECIES: ATP-binding cassette domain-containing protein [unclassified Clostridium]|uniref:ATP-binding cassette domain-containing protein n=1 Tax=unclassified Clostridium TaxID=2614128 RepID=UPI002A7F8129|nr:ATP-binding cassette domain-containing protein [Clostridium sp.]MDY4251885.1 ATP-binding cassette domain-containing protein [Clostridium sp.]
MDKGGTVEVFGKTIGKDIDFPEGTGLIIETPGFLPNLTGMKNLEILAGLSGNIDKNKIKEAISFVGLDPNDKKTVKKYSLGMKQRLGIAQAIMEDPKLIILDEPMNSLDESGVEDVRKYILKQKEKGVSLILTSHNKDDIELLCDTVYSMDNGKISLVK